MRIPMRFPDAVFVAVKFLQAATGVPVYGQMPESLPAGPFIRVDRLGGARNTVVTDRPRLDIHCWGDSEEAAEELLALTRAHLGSMHGRHENTTVYRVREVTGPQWLPDSLTGRPRYAFAVEVSMRGTELEP